MNVFMDGLFITTSRLQRTNPGEEFKLYLGVDSAVRVEVKPQSKQEETSGIFVLKKTVIKTSKFLTVVKNNKRHQVTVLVFDPILFSSDKSIVVKVKEPAEPSEYAINEESIMKRSFTLAAGEEKKVKLSYVVEAPSDKHLYYVPQVGGELTY